MQESIDDCQEISNMIGRVKANGFSFAVMFDKKILKAISKFSKTNLKADD